MNSGDYNDLWQAKALPNWRFDFAALAGPMSEVSRAQGLLMGRLADVGMALRDPMQLVSGPIGRQRVPFEAPPADDSRVDSGSATSSGMTGPRSRPSMRS